MISCYVRSSSYGTFQLCSNKFFIEYIIGLKGPPNEKASFGSVFHKSAEILGRYKLALQNNLDIVDCEELGSYPIKDVTPELAFQLAFEHYKQIEQPHWRDKEFKLVEKWFYDALAYGGGMYDPRNLDIINVEQTFDFEIDQPWALYNYKLPDGNDISGRLSIKGTIDQIVREDENTIHVYDYKTGKREDIITGKLKELDDLEKDFQINLYRYAVRKLFPEYKNILFTIWFTNNGGPFTLYKTPTNEEFELELKKHFYQIRLTERPGLINSDKSRRNLRWFCDFVCGFYKNDHEGTGKSTCQFFQDEVKKHGINKVTAEHANLNIIKTYQSGGGRQAKGPE